jgi:DnaJ like chaperone protein
MNRYFKWVAGGLGWAMGGPIGAILGYALGNLVENLDKRDFVSATDVDPKTGRPIHTQPGDFEVSLLILASVVIKADGKTQKEELDYVRNYFAKMYGAKHANASFRLFKGIVDQDISIHRVSAQIRQHMSHSARLQLLYFLFGIAKSDGKVSQSEVDVIHKIATYLYINEKDFLSIRSMYAVDDSHYYEILEVNPESTDEEIKKSYRRLVKKFHPDMVEGLGTETRKGAEEKFRKVQMAYEALSKERGIK